MSVFYLIFIALSAYYSFRYDSIEEYNPHKQHRLWLMCGYLICLSGFSYGLGADKFTYMIEFEDYPNDFSDTADFILYRLMLKGQMPLWTIVNLFCKTVFNSFYAVQFLESAAINITVCYLASKYTHRYFLFLLVYFFSLQYFIFNTEVMREGFALAFVLLGIDRYIQGKRWIFFLMLIIGLMFHISAAIALLVLFTRFPISISWKTLTYSFLIAFFIWLLSDLVLSKIVLYALEGMGAFVEKIIFYSFQAVNIFGFLRYALTYLIIPFIIMYSVIQLEQSEQRRVFKERWTVFMIPLGIIASSAPGFIRFYNYVEIIYLIMLTDFIATLIRYKEHLLIRLGAMAWTLLILFVLYFGHYNSTDTYFYNFFYPYTCILDEDDSVYFRETAHQEALSLDVQDDNVRDVK